MQAGSDVSASLTAWGSWQPALAPTRGPTVLDALIGSLGSRGSNRVSCRSVLLVFFFVVGRFPPVHPLRCRGIAGGPPSQWLHPLRWTQFSGQLSAAFLKYATMLTSLNMATSLFQIQGASSPQAWRRAARNFSSTFLAVQRCMHGFTAWAGMVTCPT